MHYKDQVADQWRAHEEWAQLFAILTGENTSSESPLKWARSGHKQPETDLRKERPKSTRIVDFPCSRATSRHVGTADASPLH